MNKTSAISFLCLLLAVGCSSSVPSDDEASSSPAITTRATPSTETEIDSLPSLRDAYIDAGGSCDQFDLNESEPTGQGATCDGVYLSWFADPELVSVQLGELLGNPYDGPALVGDDWVVYSQDADALQHAMGGSVQRLAYV